MSKGLFRNLAIAALLLGLVGPVLSLVGPVPSTAALTEGYTIVDLGVLPDTAMSVARSVNDVGQVAGVSYKGFFSAPRGFVYSEGQLTDIAPLGGDDTRPASINNSGDIAGTSNNHAFLFRNGVMQDLGSLPGGVWSYAEDINDAGLVVGGAIFPGLGGDIPPPYRAFIYRDGVMQDIGAPSGFQQKIYARAVNNVGQVVCIGGHIGERRAFLYRDGIFQELFAPDANGSPSVVDVVDINDNGFIAGSKNNSSAFIYGNGAFTDLGSLGGLECNTCVQAHGMNNAGQVVGRATVPGSNNFHAFLYSDGTMRDLNNLIPPGSGWELIAAYDISNQGEIVGFGTISGQTHAFRLTPVAPPNTSVIATDAGTDHAIALDSVNLLRDPFPRLNTHNFSADHRTRVMLFVRNVLLLPGENSSALRVEAEDPQHRTYTVAVEAASRMSWAADLTEVIILLPDLPEEVTELRFTVYYHAAASNKAFVNIAR